MLDEWQMDLQKPLHYLTWRLVPVFPMHVRIIASSSSGVALSALKQITGDVGTRRHE